MRAPLTTRAYTTRNGYRITEPVAEDFTIEQIEEIIRSGNLEAIRELSRYYYRTNSEYKNNIDFLAHLSLYDWAIIPLFSEDEKGSRT